jgi:hypothetical protein
MFIAQIDLRVREAGRNWKAIADVTLDTDNGCSAGGALVEGSWYLNAVLFGSSSAVADVNGVATLISPPRKAVTDDVFKIVVTSVSKEGVDYDPSKNIETEDSITVNGVTPLSDTSAPAWMPPRSFGSGSFAFNMTLSDHVRVSAGIYDASGRLVKRLAHGMMGPGPLRLVWDGSDGGGRRVPSGVYYYMVRAGAEGHQGKLVMVR